MITFEPTYWGPEKSVKATFEPILTIPPTNKITACMVSVFNEDGDLLLIKSHRGWELPGGHREKFERPIACAKREVYEEASVTLDNLKLIGRWNILNIFESDFNKDYPKQAYQLLFMADVKEILAFNNDYETTDRKFVKISKIEGIHKNITDFRPILNYINETRQKGL